MNDGAGPSVEGPLGPPAIVRIDPHHLERLIRRLQEAADHPDQPFPYTCNSAAEMLRAVAVALTESITSD